MVTLIEPKADIEVKRLLVDLMDTGKAKGKIIILDGPVIGGCYQ